MPRRTLQQVEADLKFVRDMKEELTLKAAKAYEDSLKVQKVNNPDEPLKIGFVSTDWMSDEDKELFESLKDGEGKLTIEGRYAGKSDAQVEALQFSFRALIEHRLAVSIAVGNDQNVQRYTKRLEELDKEQAAHSQSNNQ